MKVFVTGASGFIGSALLSELVSSGNEVIGLARSEESATKIESISPTVKVLRGDLRDLDTLRKGATDSEAVVHLGFVHDFANYDRCCEIDRKATVAMLESLKVTNKQFIYTNGSFGLHPGKVAYKEDTIDEDSENLRAVNEETALSYKDKGVSVRCVRLAPTVHGKGDRAFVPILMDIAQASGKSGYVGDGHNLWPAIHRLDAARLFRLVLKKGRTGEAYHGIAEQGIPFKEIAKVIGEIINVPVASIPECKAGKHFSFMNFFVTRDGPVSSVATRKDLEWEPQQVGPLEDIRTNYRLN
ncbi:YLL056C [Saccharomyces arboricola H-6]|uniref:YLL056C n=1 Tax=Saccharomyces arboricola (strain H-6 / AS 2.3317 / CBS 10644) TaxID=1160507 RepID=J8PL17_SACAR|nr:YLL056C [Saccharomyces arboricola H-6]